MQHLDEQSYWKETRQQDFFGYFWYSNKYRTVECTAKYTEQYIVRLKTVISMQAL